MKEIDLIEKKDAREKLISRIDVLDKVKKVNTLADTDYMTTNQVAEFYEVNQDIIRQLYKRNKDELLSDNATHLKYAEIKKLINRDNLSQLGISPNGSVIYPKRAVLRVGMLLRDSNVAKEIRTMLLNVYYDASKGKEDILKNINEDYTLEQELTMKAGKAIMDGNTEEFMIIMTQINDFKNKRIEKLEDDIDTLNYNTLTITDTRDALNAIIRKIAVEEYNFRYGEAWSELYRLLNYQIGININAREGKGSKLNRLTPEEMTDALKIAKNWAHNIGLDVQDILSLYKSKQEK